MSRSKAIGCSLIAWLAVFIFWLVTTRNFHPTCWSLIRQPFAARSALLSDRPIRTLCCSALRRHGSIHRFGAGRDPHFIYGDARPRSRPERCVRPLWDRLRRDGSACAVRRRGCVGFLPGDSAKWKPRTVIPTAKAFLAGSSE
jgi:hypothetical protein